MDREKNARREAQRQGLILRKSRIDGTWTILDPGSHWGIVGNPPNSRGDQGWSLEDVEEYLLQRVTGVSG
jgi:hypothetical protein